MMINATKRTPFSIAPSNRNRAGELDFHPAALEIIDTPASPLSHVTAMILAALIAIAIIWICLGKVDIIATATGRIIPSGQVKLIQPLEIGVVKAIRAADGDHVRAGDILIELDPTSNEADQERIGRDLTQTEVDIARLSALLADGVPNFAPPAETEPAMIEAARQQIVAELAARRAKLDGIDRQIDAKAAARAEANASIAKIDASLPIAKEENQIYESLRKNEYSSKVEGLRAKRELVDAQHDRAIAIQQVAQAEADIAALKQQRQEVEQDFRRQTLDDLAKAKQKAAEEREEQVKATQKTGLQTLRAPIDGTVEQLSIHTIGGVVTPAQSLLVLVPDGNRLTVEAMLPNREVGFVHAGQEAEVKVEAFDYTRYGLLKGTVERVSRDALRTTDRDAVNEQDEDPAAAARAKRANEPRDQESAYVARVALSKTYIDTELGPTPLEPGMAVIAEIKTGQRRVIDYLLSPLVRLKHDGIKER